MNALNLNLGPSNGEGDWIFVASQGYPAGTPEAEDGTENQAGQSFANHSQRTVPQGSWRTWLRSLI